MTDQPTWGSVEPGLLERVVVVSPHFDDAVLGASFLLGRHPGTTVVTVMGGVPDAYPDPVTEWDALGGFVAGDDVVEIRREEDRLALAVVGATQRYLDFVDHQYGDPRSRPSPDEVAGALAAVLDEVDPTAVFLPTGLANPDHGITHDAGLVVQAARPGLAWFYYQEAGYAQLPGLLAWRLAHSLRRGLWPTPALVPVEPDLARKERALRCYASQLPPLEKIQSLDEWRASGAGEQYYRLAPPPKGWEGLVDVE